MKLCFSTQDYENYGTEDSPYWKAKGGEEFIIEAPEWTLSMTDKVCKAISINNPFFQRSVVGFEEVSDDFMTSFEKSQLEYDGEVQFPAVRCSYEEFVAMSKETV